MATEEGKLRSSAEKWIAGVTALFSLFGLAGLVVGKDTFVGVRTETRVVAGLAAGLAVIMAAWAIVLVYRAAFGWPTDVDISNDELLTKWFEGRRGYLRTALGDLKNGVRLSLLSLAGLVVAVGCIWFWPRDTPVPQVQVTRRDDSQVCGKVVDTTTDRELRVRRQSGEIEAIRGADLKAVKNVGACKS